MTLVSADPITFRFNTRMAFVAWQITKDDEPIEWVKELFESESISWRAFGRTTWLSIDNVKVANPLRDDTADPRPTSAEETIFALVKKDQGYVNDWLVKIADVIYVIPAAFFSSTVVTAVERMRDVLR